MIKKIFIQNYKIFEQFDLELNSDLDIIVGDNEVGKSTILEELKTKIRQAQYKAVISANKEMIFLYSSLKTLPLNSNLLIFMQLTQKTCASAGK